MTSNGDTQFAITFLIPIYNGEKYLAEALQSVATQTYTDFKVLMINDHSTDRSAEIASEFLRDPRFRLVENPGEKGLVSVLNYGLSLIDTPWVARFDSDDICLPERIEKQVAYLRQHPEIVVLGTAFQMFGSSGVTTVIHHPVHPVDVAWRFCWNTRVGHPTVVFKRSVIAEFGNYPDKRAEDFNLFSRVAARYSVSNLPEVLLHYRWHGENKSFVEREHIGSEVFEICSASLRTYGVPTSLHTDFVHFHWGMRVPLRSVREIAMWSLRILLKLARVHRNDSQPSAFWLVVPRGLGALIRFAFVQVKARF